MLERTLKEDLHRRLKTSSAVALLGPRQVGKTTLARQIADEQQAIFLDLERAEDLAKLSNVEQYCRMHTGKLLVMDEIHHRPDLFVPLRPIIDERRRSGHTTGQFLFLGSASPALLRQSGESLAGRISYCELRPLSITEVGREDYLHLWYRGGFPESFLADEDIHSLQWREDLISTLLARDIPTFGPQIPLETMRRFWTMLAHRQGQTHNASALAKGLDFSDVTTNRYLDLMVDLLLVRRLPPWRSNLGRRLVKAPKVYIRDSGLCHALLGIRSLDDLMGHPVVGASWENFVMENILALLPDSAIFGHYRTSNGTEVDLVIEVGGEIWAVEIKRSTAPSVGRGFHSACEDISPARKLVVHGGDSSFPLSQDVEAVCLADLPALFPAAFRA